MCKLICLFILVCCSTVNASSTAAAGCECASEGLVSRAVAALFNAAVLHLEHIHTRGLEPAVGRETLARCEEARWPVPRTPAGDHCASKESVAAAVSTAVSAAVDRLQRTFRCRAAVTQGLIHSRNIIFSCYDSQGYKYFPECGGCYRLHEQNLDWKEASVACRREGSHLAVANSRDELRVLGEIAAEPRLPKWPDDLMWAFVGVYRDEGGLWRTVTGETLDEALGFDGWRNAFPSDKDLRGKYVAVYTGELVNMPDGWGNYFICEKELK